MLTFSVLTTPYQLRHVPVQKSAGILLDCGHYCLALGSISSAFPPNWGNSHFRNWSQLFPDASDAFSGTLHFDLQNTPIRHRSGFATMQGLCKSSAQVCKVTHLRRGNLLCFDNALPATPCASPKVCWHTFGLGALLFGAKIDLLSIPP